MKKDKTEGNKKFIQPRYEHKGRLFMWNVIAHEDAKWSVWDGLEFSDYYFVQHKIFKWIKTIKCFGYKPTEHPYYKTFCLKYFNPHPANH